MLIEEKYICPNVATCRGAPECTHSIPHERMFGCVDDEQCPKCEVFVPKQAEMSDFRIKPCPFCGGTDIHITEHPCGDGYWFIQCWNDECCAMLDDLDTPNDCVTLWNTRTELEE